MLASNAAVRYAGPGAHMAGEHEHHHDHDHHHDHGVEELAPGTGPADPGRRARWRVLVALGGGLGLTAWIGWPALHLLTVERALRHISGSTALLGLCLSLAVATWLVTATPDPRPASAHRAGQIALRIVASCGAGLGVASFALGRGVILIELLAFPVALAWLLLGFAYLGRVARLQRHARLANLADLCGLVLPLLWIAGQTLSGEPGLLLYVPAATGMLAGAAVLFGTMATSVMADRHPTDAT